MTPATPERRPAPLDYLPTPDGLAPYSALRAGNPELAVRVAATPGAGEAWMRYVAASRELERQAVAARWASDPDRELVEQLLRGHPSTSLDTGQQPSNNDASPPARDPGDVHEAVLGVALGRVGAIPERDWRRDDLQELVATLLAAGAAAYGQLPTHAQPWLGAGRSETPAALWLQRRSDAAERCRTGLAWTDATCGVSIFRPDSCHVRGCPRCESARSSRLVDRFMAAAAGCPPSCRDRRHLLDCRPGCAAAHTHGTGHLRPMRSPALHTFTIPNADREKVAEATKVLKRSFLRLRQRAVYRGGRCRTRGWAEQHATWLREHGRHGCLHQPPGSRVRCPGGRLHRACGRFSHRPVTGGVYAVETTWNELSDTYNVHLHVLVEAPYITQAELADTWAAVVPAEWRAGRDSLVVDVRRVKCRTHGDRCRCEKGMRAALKEVLKYVGKPTEQDPRQQSDPTRLKGAGILDADDPGRFVELVLAWHGARLVSGFGAWASLPKDVTDPGPTVFVSDHRDSFGGWRLPRWCPHCGHEARWSQPTVVSRLEAFRWLRDDGGPAPPPLSWVPTPPLVSLPH